MAADVNRDHKGFHASRVNLMFNGKERDPIEVPSFFTMRKSMWMASFFEPKSESMDLPAREKLSELVKQRIREAFEKAVTEFVFFDYRDIIENAENLSLLSAVSHFIPHIPFDWDVKIKGARRWKFGFRKSRRRLNELLEAIDEAAEARR